MHPLETIIGHTFRSLALLDEALSHSSLSYESQRHQADNQRLEFLGDAVLQITLSDELYRRLPDADEGALTKARSQLVSTKALARLARSLQLGPHIRMGRGEEQNGGRDRDNILADTLEAIAGAIFLDSGLEAAARFVLHVFSPGLDTLDEDEHHNPKGQLQELTQSVTATPPAYTITAITGPDHDRTFAAAVSWQGISLGAGTGRSKKEAEVAAARQALSNPEFAEALQRAGAQP